MQVLDLRDAENECGESAASLVRRALAGLPGGQRLEVLTGTAEHVFVVEALASQAQRRVLADARAAGEHRLLIG